MTKEQFKHFVINGNSGWLRVSVILCGIWIQSFNIGQKIGEIKLTINENYKKIEKIQNDFLRKTEHEEYARGVTRELDNLNRRRNHESDRENKKA